MSKVLRSLRSARPTAVNLSWALGRMEAIIGQTASPWWKSALLAEAKAIHREDSERCDRIGALGAGLLSNVNSILTICNTGRLATGGIGTALGIVHTLHRRGWKGKVYVLETRPLLQGARLTMWELAQMGVDATLLVDAAAASLMASGAVGCCLIGADRIASNGDTANKIGSLMLSRLAGSMRVPLYVAAPESTIDRSLANGQGIPIEHRAASEVTRLVKGASAFIPKVYNPAFDIVPGGSIAVIITEKEIYYPPYQV